MVIADTILVSSLAIAQQMPGNSRTSGIFGTTREADRPVYNPDGTVRMPDGSTQYPDGTIVFSDSSVRYPYGTTSRPQQNRSPVYGNEQNQYNGCSCIMPPGQAKKMYGNKCAKDYAHGKKQCQQQNRNDRYNDDDDRYDDRNVNRYPQTYTQYPQYSTKRNK